MTEGDNNACQVEGLSGLFCRAERSCLLAKDGKQSFHKPLPPEVVYRNLKELMESVEFAAGCINYPEALAVIQQRMQLLEAQIAAKHDGNGGEK